MRICNFRLLARANKTRRLINNETAIFCSPKSIKSQTWHNLEPPASSKSSVVSQLWIIFIATFRKMSSIFYTFLLSNTRHRLPPCNIAICCTVFVIPVLADMAFKLLSAGWHLIKIWDLHLSWEGGVLCRCLRALCAQPVLIFCSSAGPQRVQQMFPSVPVLRRAADRGVPQFSQDGHVSIHGPLLICYTGTQRGEWNMPGFRIQRTMWESGVLITCLNDFRGKKRSIFVTFGKIVSFLKSASPVKWPKPKTNWSYKHFCLCKWIFVTRF